MTMTNDVLEQLNYLKLKSAYSYLNSLVMNNEIAEEELHVMHKILNKEVIAKEENNRLYNVKVAAFPFLRKVDEMCIRDSLRLVQETPLNLGEIA